MKSTQEDSTQHSQKGKPLNLTERKQIERCEWKQQLQQGAAQLFVRKNKADKNVTKPEKKVNDLEQLVRQREYELAWLKKAMSVPAWRDAIK
ncbi:MAG: hypothetical protein IJN29_08150 [Akkermansia sp.]|nr:hypothetical protein [Akkermansia sp.]